jgi:protein ImuB
MNKRFLSLHFRHLLTDWLTIRKKELAETAPVHSRIVITAANLLAEKQGVTVGMAAADAKAIVPNLKVVSDIPGQAAKLLNALGEWCIRYSPLIAVDLPDGLILDISGCAHLWGGERGYLKEIILRLKSKGYDVRGAIADTVGTAWAIARFGKIKPIIEPGQQEEALLDLPPSALRLEPLIIERLQKLGFYNIKSFIRLNRSALRSRFGQSFITRLDQALGNVEEHLQLLHPVQVYAERLPCLEPIKTRTGIEIAIKVLLDKLVLSLAGKGIRTALLKGYRVDGEIIQAQIGTNRPSNDTNHLFKLFELKIELLKPKLGIELFTLEAIKVEDIELKQEILWAQRGCGLEDAALAELLDRLTNKVGADKIHRYLPQERYWPEASVRLAQSLKDKPATIWTNDKLRPPLLLPRPERIEVMALLPDNPPMLFIYKGVRHVIKKADDAERIEREWWLDEGAHRDYYVVEDQEGRRYWIYRSGYYDDDTSHWFIHGFFA